MKKTIIIALAAACSFTACDLERLPFDKQTDKEISESPEGPKMLLTGCYDQMKAWSDVMHRVGEYAGDNIMIRGASTDGFYTFISYQHTPNNDRLNTFWSNSYKVISQSSYLMTFVKEGESKAKDQQLGEAHYLRGLMYFYLCRAYGRPYYQSPDKNLGVPIINGMPSDLNHLNLSDRATVKDTYAQAIADLRKSEALMNEDKSSAYATKEAAQAMLSRIYLYMSGTWDNPNKMYADSAIYYADKVIASGRFHMLDTETYKKSNTLAPEDNSETIFAVKRVSTEYSGYDHYYGIGGMYSNIDGMGWGEMYASAKYLKLLNKAGRGKDVRSTFIHPQYDLVNDKKVPCFRFVKNVYDKTGAQTSYGYVQYPTEVAPDGSLKMVVTEKVKDAPDKITKYDLKPIDAAQGYYEIQWAGKTYSGETDYMMLLNNSYPMFYVYKCSQQGGESQLYSPLISGLDEIYLIKAEAYAKKGDYAKALENLNIVRTRAIPDGAYSSLDATNAAQLIGEERQLEMAFEADRSFDVYRNGGTLTRHYPGAHNGIEEILPTDTRVVQFVPQDQINAYNTNGCVLTQNP